jgi:signal-transduction protein with cAMP-binding, CBS, and nucleotidyltransferase domain
MKSLGYLIQDKGAHINFVQSGSRVIDALALMAVENVPFVVIMQDGKYLGIMSERDYAQKLVLKGKNSSDTTVNEIMTTDLPTDDTADHALLVMRTFRTNILPVFEDYAFAGIVTMNMLMGEAMREMQHLSSNADQGKESFYYWI